MIINFKTEPTVPETPRPDFWYKYSGERFASKLTKHSANVRTPVWVTDRGELIALSDMAMPHIHNLFRTIQNKWLGDDSLSADAQVYVRSWQTWLVYELGRREASR